MTTLLRLALCLLFTEAGFSQNAAPDANSAALVVLQQKADECKARKDFVGMEAMFRAQITMQPGLPNPHYNLACALALQGKTDDALKALTQSVATGFADAKGLEADDDLASLRVEPAFAAAKAIAELNQRTAGQPASPAVNPASVPMPAPVRGAVPAATDAEPGPPMTKQEIIDILKARIGTDGPHPQKEAVNLELRELIKKRGVSFRYSTLSDRHLFTQVGGIGSMIDAVEANYGKPKPKSWLWGEWNISTTSTRTFSLSNAVNQMGFLVIEPDGKYLWKVKADDETKNWIDGKWREPTADEMKWMGGAGVVLIGGEQGYDWIVHRDYTADDGKDWITIAVINSRQTFRSGLRVP
ncbi:MAG: hypothetical protein JNM99_19895 [Verrucomicrobiaceae bacterium]|nr:hypothetical protein [Verrucomicrobiaceae bacterium]